MDVIRSYVIPSSRRVRVRCLRNTSDQPTLLSLNRFEEKKNVALAIKSFSRLQTANLIPADKFTKLRLVVGGEWGWSYDLGRC